MKICVRKIIFKSMAMIGVGLLMINSPVVSADKIIVSCVNNTTGAVRIVSAKTLCSAKEHIVRWNNISPVNINPFATIFADNTISGVSVNGGNDHAHVVPGASYTVAFDFTTKVTGCPDCIEQIVVGLANEKPAACAYDSIPGTTGVTGNGSVTLTAPVTPGTYFVAVNRTLQFSCADALSAAPPLKNFIGTISVY